ncbi:MAG: AAA family ATPase, partial [Clostridiales bacterium]|nr:AAA family ATPase [Clostridiales bacterium]
SILKKYNDKVMRGAKNIRKFNADSNHRIIWSKGQHLNGIRPEEENDVFLMAYTDHDEQFNVSVNMQKDINRQNYYKIEAGESSQYEEMKRLVRLTNTQIEYANSQLPLMISGGAGNGKTLVSVHKLININNTYPGSKTAYFTLTEKLRSNAIQMYQKSDEIPEESTFFNIYDFFIDYLNVKADKFVLFSRFNSWYQKYAKSNQQYEAMDIWVEIRGTIKGYAGAYWIRNNPFHMTLITEKTKRYLLGKKRVRYIDKTKKDLVCTSLEKDTFGNIYDDLDKDNHYLPVQKVQLLKDIKKIEKYIEKSKYKSSLISQYEYQHQDNDVSQYSNEEKEEIYSIAVDYQAWLLKTKQYDDNDLALKLLSNKDNNLFDFIVVDEVQDLPEIQILALLTLLENKNNAVFSGDIHQVLQPNVFTPSRLKELYKNKIDINYLQVNHRSQGQIVDFTNNLSALRRHLIGSRKKESELREEAVWRGLAPYLLDLNSSNLKSALEVISKHADAAIITTGNKERNDLKSILGTDSKIANIYTVAEIKGLEFDYIFCYNLIGRNKEYWQDIFNNKVKHIGKYRYYFNILYVAGTRARETLCFCEDRNLYNIIELQNLFKNTIPVAKFSTAGLNLKSGMDTPKEWEEKAVSLEHYGVYDKAALYFANAQNLKAETRCIIRQSLKLGEINSNKAMEKLYELGENELAYSLSTKHRNRSMQIKGYIRNVDFTVTEIEKEFSEKHIFNYYKSKNISIVEKRILEERYLIPKVTELENVLQKNTELFKIQAGEIK